MRGTPGRSQCWTPDGGSPTAQALGFPLTSTDSMTRNGVLVRYSSMGINLVGVIPRGPG
jgi:hypothetical protein